MWVSDHKNLACLIRSRNQLIRLRECVGDGLFQKNVAAGPKAIKSHRMVQVVGDQHEGTIDFIETFTIVRQSAGSRLTRDILSASAVGIRRPNDCRGATLPAKAYKMERSNPPAADEAYFMGAHTPISP